MKKSMNIISNCCIAFVFVLFALILGVVIYNLARYSSYYPEAKLELQNIIEHPEIADEFTTEAIHNNVLALKTAIINYSIYTVIGFLALGACVFIFIYCNPRLFRRSTWTNLSEEWAKNKAERLARKQAQSEANKQKRIEELQAQLDELKKDE